MPPNNAAACKRLPAPRCLSSPAEYVAHLCQHQCPLYPRKRTLPHAIMTTRPSAAKPSRAASGPDRFRFFLEKIANGWAAICPPPTQRRCGMVDSRGVGVAPAAQRRAARQRSNHRFHAAGRRRRFGAHCRRLLGPSNFSDRTSTAFQLWRERAMGQSP